MLYIATVHYLTDKWIDVQLRYIKKHTKCEYKIFACVPAPCSSYSDLYYYCSDYSPGPGSTQNHADKLNYLAKGILKEADDDDMLLFLDGDAFPIADYVPFTARMVKKYKLAAIRRDENVGDVNPHPSFCATTAGFWKEIGGDWRIGYAWKNGDNAFVSDTGGNLLGKLKGYRWYPLRRSNKVNLHPLWFGVYDDIVYHHGAGFRPPVSRADLSASGMGDAEYLQSREYQKIYQLRVDVFNQIKSDEYFYEMFTGNRYYCSLKRAIRNAFAAIN